MNKTLLGVFASVLIFSVSNTSIARTDTQKTYEKVLTQFKAGSNFRFEAIENKLYFGYCWSKVESVPTPVLFQGTEFQFGPMHTDRYIGIVAATMNENQFQTMDESFKSSTAAIMKDYFLIFLQPLENEMMEYKSHDRSTITKVRSNESGHLIATMGRTDNVSDPSLVCYFHLNR